MKRVFWGYVSRKDEVYFFDCFIRGCFTLFTIILLGHKQPNNQTKQTQAKNALNLSMTEKQVVFKQNTLAQTGMSIFVVDFNHEVVKTTVWTPICPAMSMLIKDCFKCTFQELKSTYVGRTFRQQYFSFGGNVSGFCNRAVDIYHNYNTSQRDRMKGLKNLL